LTDAIAYTSNKLVKIRWNYRQRALDHCDGLWACDIKVDLKAYRAEDDVL
jgi:hypothetical protein